MANDSKKTNGKKTAKVKTDLTLRGLLKEIGLTTATCRACNKKSDVEDLIASVFSAITDAVNKGRSVKIFGFGKFSPKTYAGRTQKSGLPGVKGGVATFGDVKLMKFKLSAMAKDKLAGLPPRERANAAQPVTKSAKTVAPATAPAPDPSTPVQGEVVKPSRKRAVAPAVAKPEDVHSSPTVSVPADATGATTPTK